MAGSPQTEGRLAEVKFLTVAEVATLMRVSKMTVYRLVHSGELTAVRVGRSFRVPEHAVHEYLRGAFQRVGLSDRVCPLVPGDGYPGRDPTRSLRADSRIGSRQSIRCRQRWEGIRMGSVVKKRRKRMAKKKHRKLLRKTRVQRRRLGK